MHWPFIEATLAFLPFLDFVRTIIVGITSIFTTLPGSLLYVSLLSCTVAKEEKIVLLSRVTALLATVYLP